MIDHKLTLDYLSHLPSELLDDIFHHAHDPSRPLSSPLSRTLLPFQRRQLFRSVKVASYTSLENLCTIAQRPSNIPSYIRHLEVNIEFSVEPVSGVSEAEDPGSPSTNSIEQFVRQLSTVQTVTIKGSTRVALSFLSNPIDTASLPKLRSLEIASTLHSLPDPFDTTNYARLQSFPRLDTLNLNIPRYSTEIVPTSHPQAPSKPFGSNLTHLHLTGPITASLSSAQRLISLVTSPSSLTIFDTSGTSSLICNLLDAVRAPDKVGILTIGCLSQPHPIVQGAFFEHVKTFTSLKGLGLLSDFASASPHLYSDLRTLPLAVLGFQSTAKVSLSQITSLITGPTKHSTLGGVVFSQVEGKIGTKIEEVGKPYYNREEEQWELYHDWVLPKWTEEFSEKGLVEFLEVAKKEGITVQGTAVGAIGIMAQREKEWELLEEYEPDDEANEEENE